MSAIILSADRADVREVTWWIPGLIPHNRVTIIDGDPGHGKSMLTLEMAAAMSCGQIMTPTGWRASNIGSGAALILNAEDDVECTMLPRLVAAKADLP